MLPWAKAVKRLGVAFRKNDLTIYVGAGASAASGIPTWYDLVLTVFFNSLRIWRGNDPLLDAIQMATAERWFAQSHVSLEVVARELRTSFRDSADFLRWVSYGLYQNFEFDSHGYPTRRVESLLRRNLTLRAIVRLCRQTRPGNRGVRAVVNYNLDGLLEMALGSYPFQSIWKQMRIKPGALPIYHVHGYLPVRGPWMGYSQKMGSSPDEIVLTEDQYHREAADPYSWANLVQLQAMSSSVGLTIGLSLSDPNMRRLLEVSRRASSRSEIYALLQKPETTALDEVGLEEIGNIMQQHLGFHDRRYRSSLPRPDVKSMKWRKRIQQIWVQLERVGLQRQVLTLRELGIEPIWCRHAEIASVAEHIVNSAG